MTKTLRCALIGCSTVVLVIVLIPVANSASLSVANRNSVEWKHLISKRASENTPLESVNETEIKSDHHVHQNNDLAKPDFTIFDPQTDGQTANFENDDVMQNVDRTIDWQNLDGNPATLNEELSARRRRRSAASTRVAEKLSNANRLRLKRDLYLMDENDDLSDDDNADGDVRQETDLTQDDLANLESLIYQLEESNRQDDEPDVDRRYVINTDDLAYGDDRSAFEVDQDQVEPLTSWTPDDDDEGGYDRLSALYPKDKRSSVVADSAELYDPEEASALSDLVGQRDSDNDDNDEDETAVVYMPVEVYDGGDDNGDNDDDRAAVSFDGYESDKERKEKELEQRIRVLAQYLNSQKRR